MALEPVEEIFSIMLSSFSENGLAEVAASWAFFILLALTISMAFVIWEMLPADLIRRLIATRLGISTPEMS